MSPVSLRASATGEAFNTATGTLNVNYAGYMSKQDVVYNSPVTNPVEGLTVGNGKLGMMVWSGNGLTAQISGVDDSEQGAFSEGLINLVTNPGFDTGYTTFQQRLSLYNGTLTTTYDSNRTITIMGEPGSEVMGIHVNDTRTGVTSVTLQLSIWSLTGLNNNGNVPNLTTWETVSTYANSTSAGFSRGQADPGNFGYTLAASVEGTPFTTQVVNGSTVQLNITPATSYTIWIACASRLNAPGNNSLAQAQSLLSAVTGTYTATMVAYETWWNAFWAKSFVEFSDSTATADYIENLYYLATYMIAAGGYGNYPFHFINGVFRATDDNTKWSNAYWYWNQRDVYNSFLASNHSDMMNTFNNLYARNASTLQTQTSSRYSLSGTWVPETMGWNGNDSGTVDSSYTDNIYSSGTEAVANMYREYQYTNNYSYLTGTAYPFMKQVCTFYANILSTNSNGKYYMPLVVDGNFADNAHETYWKVQDAITDLAAIRSLFPETIAAAQLQGVDSTLVTQWQNILNNLVAYPVDPGNSGQYYPCDPPLPAASNDENITCELPWPYGVVGLATSDLSFGISNWNNRPFPYGNVWSPDSIQAARLGLGNDAFLGMQIMMEKYQNYPNGMTNNTNGVFEYLGVNLSALNESLLQSYNNIIRVFPALPTNDSGLATRYTLAASGGFLVSSEMEDGNIKYVGINSLYGNPCTVANPWTGQSVDVQQVSNGAILLTTSNATFNFSTVANTVYVIQPTANPLSNYTYEQITASANQTAKVMGSNTLGTFAGSPPPPSNGVYLAGNAVLSGTASTSYDLNALGLYEVVDLSQGSALTFNNVISGCQLVIQYCTENNPGKLDLYINGVLSQAVAFPDTNSWSGTYAQVTVNVNIPAGASLKLQYDSGDSGTNINYIQITGCKTPTVTPTMTPSYTSTPTATVTAAGTKTPTATVTPTPLTVSCTNGAPMTLDGQYLEPTWGLAPWQSIPDTACNYFTGCGATDTTASAQYKLVYTPSALWIAVNVSDPGVLYADTAAPWNGSGVEIFFDLNNTKGGYNGTDFNDANTYQWCITYNANSIVQYHNTTARTILASSVATQGTGYTMEIEIPWANLGVSGPPAGGLSGLDIDVDISNAAGNARDHAIASYNAGANPYDTDPALWGTVSYGVCAPTPTSTNTPTNTPTPSSTRTSTPTLTATVSFTSTPTGTSTFTASATSTPTASNTFTFTATNSNTIIPTATYSPSGTATSTATSTATKTSASTASFTSTTTATGTATSTPTWTSTLVFTVTNSMTPIATYSSTATATPTATSTATKTSTSTASFTSTTTTTGTATSTPTQSIVYTATNTVTSTATHTVTDTNTAIHTVTNTVTNTPTETVTNTPTITKTAIFSPTNTTTSTTTPAATYTPTMTATNSATNTFTNQPTLTQTNTPTATVTNTPTVPSEIVVSNPYPNPSNGSPISFNLQVPSPSTVTMDVFTLSFRKIYGQAEQIFGSQTVQWDLKDGTGNPVGNGLYYVRLRVMEGSSVTKILKVLVLR